MPMLRPQPSFANGFARSQGESAHPELWDELLWAGNPNFGVQGNKWFDLTGRGNHGSFVNLSGVDWVVGQRGRVVNWASVVDEIDILGSNSSGHILNILGPVTVVARVRADTLGGFRRIVARDWATSYFLGMGSLSRSLAFGMDPNGSTTNLLITDISAISVNVWTHIVGTWDEATLRIYVDGVEYANKTWVNTVTGTAITTNIGKLHSGTGGTHSGDIAEVYIYGRAISPSEVMNLFLNSAAPFELKRRPVAFVPAAVVGAIPHSVFQGPFAGPFVGAFG